MCNLGNLAKLAYNEDDMKKMGTPSWQELRYTDYFLRLCTA